MSDPGSLGVNGLRPPFDRAPVLAWVGAVRSSRTGGRDEIGGRVQLRVGSTELRRSPLAGPQLPPKKLSRRSTIDPLCTLYLTGLCSN